MTHGLRFLPLLLILAGLAVGLAVHPREAPAEDAAAAGAPLERGEAGRDRRARLDRRAEAALRIARRARKIARKGLARATAVIERADRLESRLDGAEVASASAREPVSTGEDADYVALGGPSVTVEVPRSGLVEIWASVRFDDPSDGQVALYEDGRRVPIPGQEQVCSQGGALEDVLLSAAGGAGVALTLSTPTAYFFPIGCGTVGGVPGPMLFQRSPGEHTYELRYADCGCEPGEAGFSRRLLRAAGRE